MNDVNFPLELAPRPVYSAVALLDGLTCPPPAAQASRSLPVDRPLPHSQIARQEPCAAPCGRLAGGPLGVA